MLKVTRKLVTIAIPTYNRAVYLNLCLNQIYKQLHGNEEFIELIVSNNASSDNTDDIVEKYLHKGMKISYIKNSENVGMDRNFLQCFNKAKTKFVLMLSDDDILLDGSLSKIVKILKRVENQECGIVFINGFGYDKNFKLEKPKQKTSRTLIYHNLNGFIKKVNYFFTLISGNIINKSIWNKKFKLNNFFIGSYLTATALTFSTLFNSKFNIYIEDFIIARKRANTGDFKFCQIYGRNLDTIFQYFTKKGINKEYFAIIRRRLLMRFFPYFIYKFRTGDSSGYYYIKENYYRNLYPIYRNNVLFWILTMPIIKLPSYFLKIFEPAIKITEIGIRKGLIQ